MRGPTRYLSAFGGSPLEKTIVVVCPSIMVRRRFTWSWYRSQQHRHLHMGADQSVPRRPAKGDLR